MILQDAVAYYLALHRPRNGKMDGEEEEEAAICFKQYRVGYSTGVRRRKTDPETKTKNGSLISRQRRHTLSDGNTRAIGLV